MVASRSTALKSLVLSGSLLAGMMIASAPAWATDDGYDNVFASVLTAVGVLPAPKTPDIDYRDRPPLVLPPKMDLTNPQKTAARPASWPNDPDVIKARKANQAARAPDGNLSDKWHDGSLLSRDEIARGRGETTEDPHDTSMCGAKGSNETYCERLTPDQMRAQDDAYRHQNPDKDKGGTLQAGVEPPREYLTQPPTGYMKATKTVKATAEAPQSTADTSSPYYGLIQKPKRGDDE